MQDSTMYIFIVLKLYYVYQLLWMDATLDVQSIATSNVNFKIKPLGTWVVPCDAADLSLAFLLGGLGVRLVVATDPIANHRESEFFKDVALIRSEVQQPTSQSVVVLSLLGGVVARGILEVFFLVPQKIVFQLWVLFPRELWVVKSSEMGGEKTWKCYRILGVSNRIGILVNLPSFEACSE